MDGAQRTAVPAFDDGLDLVVHVRAVVKRFTTVTALDHVGLRVRRGEMHGVIGARGAGKTTLVRILAGRLRPDRGSARVLGTDPRRHAVELTRRVAYVTQDAARWSHLTGAELLATLSFLRGGDDRRRAELTERFSVDLRRAGHEDSVENRLRIELIAAFASRAELIVLDEPAVHLDADSRAHLDAVLAEERDRGRTIVLTGDLSAPSRGLAAGCDHLLGLEAGRPVPVKAGSEIPWPSAGSRALRVRQVAQSTGR